MHALIAEPEGHMVYWAELRPSGRRLALHGAPLKVGDDLRTHIWEQKETVILTSATLTTGGDTDYLRQRLAAADVDELILGSPFDYEHAALLYVVNDIPEPNRPGYQQAVEHTLTALAQATRGRLLALFTSYAQLQRTARAIRPALEENGLAVYEQGGGASPQALLEEFRTSDGAVLLGTRSFWEGVDIPGEALSVLVIVKLPFAVPSDPLVAARAETFENPFNEYQLPEAILAFRQGFGRLIRTKTDRGVVVVLDKRLLSRRYGQTFLDSLPPCTRHQGPMHRVPAVAARWLARGFPEKAENP
jgi:DNA polymerase-3 subunit epsilon/ATP-dependent DNA helicase DinG